MDDKPDPVPASDPNAPPPALDWARVIAYAIVDADVTWTGRLVHYSGDERLGPVPRLAICQNVFGGTDDVLVFFCDNDWNVLGVTGRPTIEENLEAAERWFAGITPKWVHTGVTPETAEKWMRQEYAKLACAFCRKLPPEVDFDLFSNSEDGDEKAVYVCNGCVEGMYAAIHSADKSPEPGLT